MVDWRWMGGEIVGHCSRTYWPVWMRPAGSSALYGIRIEICKIATTGVDLWIKSLNCRMICNHLVTKENME